MIINSKSWSIIFIVLGVITAVANAYLFLSEHTAWEGVMLLVGIAWIWIGISNLRRLQKADPK